MGDILDFTSRLRARQEQDQPQAIPMAQPAPLVVPPAPRVPYSRPEPEPAPPPRSPAVQADIESMNRDTAIRRIRDSLKRQSGKPWSVTGGKGTAWGWITIGVTDRQARERPNWQQELAKLLLLEGVHHQGELVPASLEYYLEYVDRAEGRPPRVLGRPYWD